MHCDQNFGSKTNRRASKRPPSGWLWQRARPRQGTCWPSNWTTWPVRLAPPTPAFTELNCPLSATHWIERTGWGAATEALGAALAAQAERGDVIFLQGDLGAGKTALARGFVRHYFANPALDVPSPSYLLHFSYQDEGSAAGETTGRRRCHSASRLPALDGELPCLAHGGQQ